MQQLLNSAITICHVTMRPQGYIHTFAIRNRNNFIRTADAEI